MFKRKQKRGSGGDSVCVLSSKKEKPLAWILVWYMNQYPCSACKMIKKIQMSHYYLFALGHFEYWMGARRDGRAIQQLVVFLRLIPMGVILHSLTFCPPLCHFPRICHPLHWETQRWQANMSVPRTWGGDCSRRQEPPWNQQHVKKVGKKTLILKDQCVRNQCNKWHDGVGKNAYFLKHGTIGVEVKVPSG